MSRGWKSAVRRPKLVGKADDLVEVGLGVAVAAEGEGAGEVRPIRGVQPVEFPRDEDLQPGAFGEVVRLFGKLRRRLRQPLGRHELCQRLAAFCE